MYVRRRLWSYPSKVPRSACNTQQGLSEMGVLRSRKRQMKFAVRKLSTKPGQISMTFVMVFGSREFS